MRVHVLRRDRLIGVLLLLSGVGAVLLAFAADLVTGGAAGFGPAQRFALMGGVGMMATTAVLRLPALQQISDGWLSRPVTVATEELLRFAGVALQLGALVLVLRLLRLENAAFHDKVLTVVLGGFVVHHLLPLRMRLSFFVALSLTTIIWVLGWQAGTWLVGLGALLIAICHLPLRFSLRVALLLLAGVGLAFARAGAVTAPWPGAIWAILGSMFMFRLIAYMYDLRHTKDRPSLTRALAYFFLLPNVVFPLFPVVDYATFKRTYYDQDALAIYQRGMRWMLVGTAHLLLYRIVYQRLTLSPTQVTGLFDLVQYVVANFGLYLRVSGQFHLIVGLLHLFGFRLPETHRFFFLASSFTDFWRRINIYWKDFMMKVFYYPAYFRLRRFGDTLALVVATLLVFFVTWATHSYQWFWILGTVLLSWTDTLFWGILAALLVINSVREVKKGRKRTLGHQRHTLAESTRLGIRIVATFSVICLLWALWTSPTLDDWRTLWSNLSPGITDWSLLFAALAGAAAVLAIGDQLLALRKKPIRDQGGTAFSPAFVRATIAVLGLYLIAEPKVTRAIPFASARDVIEDAQTADLNSRDAALLQRGYYERLTGVNKFNNQLWELYAAKSDKARQEWDQGHVKAGVARNIDDFRYMELVPNADVVFKDARLTTNQWGMRDREYTLVPPPNTFRIAVQGASYVMGEGVQDDQTFEALLERRLNAERRPGDPNVEILNFAVPNYSAAEQTALLESRIVRFQPDLLLRISHTSDTDDVAFVLARTIANDLSIPYPELQAIIEQAGVTPGMKQNDMHQRLLPFSDQIAAFVYRRSGEIARAHGMIPVWVHLPTPGTVRPPADVDRLKRFASAAGFVVLDASDAYHGFEPKSLWIAPWDRHPNVQGHQLIADRIHAVLQKQGLLEAVRGGAR